MTITKPLPKNCKFILQIFSNYRGVSWFLKFGRISWRTYSKYTFSNFDNVSKLDRYNTPKCLLSSCWSAMIQLWSISRIVKKPKSEKIHFSYTKFNRNQTLKSRIIEQPFCTDIPASDGSNTIISNIERTRTSVFEHRTDTNVFIIGESTVRTLQCTMRT